MSKKGSIRASFRGPRLRESSLIAFGTIHNATAATPEARAYEFGDERVQAIAQILVLSLFNPANLDVLNERKGRTLSSELLML